MEACEFTIRVERVDGELLMLDGLGLARAFFTGDPSAQAGGYDSLAGTGDPDRITVDDVIAMNRSMRARSEHARWTPVFDSDQAWLRAIPRELDLLEADDDRWAAIGGDALVSAAITGCIHRGIGLASATKVLHLKRPRLVPLLDRLALQMLGVNARDDPTPDQRIALARDVVTAIRREGRANISALRSIQQQLANDGIDRPVVRIFDVILWFSHPAAGVRGATRTMSVGFGSK